MTGTRYPKLTALSTTSHYHPTATTHSTAPHLIMQFQIDPTNGTFNWEQDARGFYVEHFAVISCIAMAYYPTIFTIRYLLKDSTPFDLGGSKSQARCNFIFWWEAALAIFSILGAYHVVPLVHRSWQESDGLTDAICTWKSYDGDAGNWWMYLFNLSKIWEFGDTIIIVLRKKPLILLQHYHHLATMCYCAWATMEVWRYNNTNPFFAGMNLCVHSIMYTWYAATRRGWRSPKWLMMCVTFLQLIQMVFGAGIVMIASSFLYEDDRCTWKKADPWGSTLCLFMYLSYFVLFGQLFATSYCGHSNRKLSRGMTKIASQNIIKED